MTIKVYKRGNVYMVQAYARTKKELMELKELVDRVGMSGFWYRIEYQYRKLGWTMITYYI